MESLAGLLCLGFLLVIVVVGVGFACLILEDLRSGYAVIFRRFWKNPRFGLLTLLEFLAVFAVTFSLLRWAGVLEDSVGAVLALGGIALMLAIGIVAGVHLVIGDVRELYVRRGKGDESGSGDPWEADDKEHRLQIGPAPEADDKPDDEAGED